jgi:hypothetical protein
VSKPSQHSPGPWTYDGESVWDADNCYVCSRVTPGNGRVIAAAPDMLRLLRVLTSNGTHEEGEAAHDEAEALIARLDGRK